MEGILIMRSMILGFLLPREPSLAKSVSVLVLFAPSLKYGG